MTPVHALIIMSSVYVNGVFSESCSEDWVSGRCPSSHHHPALWAQRGLLQSDQEVPGAALSQPQHREQVTDHCIHTHNIWLFRQRLQVHVFFCLFFCDLSPNCCPLWPPMNENIKLCLLTIKNWNWSELSVSWGFPNFSQCQLFSFHLSVKRIYWKFASIKRLEQINYARFVGRWWKKSV